MQAQRFRVRGLVQGVGFRWFVRARAHALGVHGRVRNEADGSVTVDAGGDADALTQLADALQLGPAGARVASVETAPVPAADLPLPFPFAIDR